MAAFTSSSASLRLLPSFPSPSLPKFAPNFIAVPLRSATRSRRNFSTLVLSSSTSPFDDLESRKQPSPRASSKVNSVLSTLIQEIEPLDVSVTQKDVPPTTLDAMKRTISGMLGLLPSGQFQVVIDAMWESLSKLLISSMMTGYTLRNAEYRLCLERNLHFSERNVDKETDENPKIDSQELFLDCSNFIKTLTNKESPSNDDNITEDLCKDMNIEEIGELSPEVQQYILNLQSSLSNARKGKLSENDPNNLVSESNPSSEPDSPQSASVTREDPSATISILQRMFLHMMEKSKRNHETLMNQLCNLRSTVAPPPIPPLQPASITKSKHHLRLTPESSSAHGTMPVVGSRQPSPAVVPFPGAILPSRTATLYGNTASFFATQPGRPLTAPVTASFGCATPLFTAYPGVPPTLHTAFSGVPPVAPGAAPFDSYTPPRPGAPPVAHSAATYGSSATPTELYEVKRKCAALQMQQFVGEEKNDLLDYLRSLKPEKVAELSEPTSPDLKETIHSVVHGLLATLSPKMHSKVPLSENIGTGAVLADNEDCAELVENTSLHFQPLISLTRDYLARLLFWCMLLGHYLRGLEYRLELMDLLSRTSSSENGSVSE